MAGAVKVLDQITHVWDRPSMYIGSIEPSDEARWIVDASGDLIQKKFVFAPGLLKLFDEVCVNAADAATISKLKGDKMRRLDITADATTGRITVENDGSVVSTAIHDAHRFPGATENTSIPHVCFGVPLAGTNFDDTKSRTTGGLNGWGVKLTNIFSDAKEGFTVEILDPANETLYTQTWTNHMKTFTPPNRKHTSKKRGYTKVSFVPAFDRFAPGRLTEDVVGLLRRRAHDVAATLGKEVKVTFNGQHVLAPPAAPVEEGGDVTSPMEVDDGGAAARSAAAKKANANRVTTFERYCKMRLGSDDEPFVHALVGTPKEHASRWELVIAAQSTGKFQHMSFVNHISTPLGGTHVNCVKNAIVNGVFSTMFKGKALEALEKENKVTPTKTVIANQLFVGINGLVENPAFESQAKEQLKSPESKWGSKCDIDDKFIKKVLSATNIRERVEAALAGKSAAAAKKTDGAKTARVKVEKLDDADWAGTKQSGECSLIVTEGLSAKALAISGLAVVGRKAWGVYPLKGKPINPREKKAEQVNNNKELNDLKKILGLQEGVTYTDVSKLRYGSLVIMSDQDQDGSHIAGLVINLFKSKFPSILHVKGFLKRFVTPVLKVKRANAEKVFYTVQDYDAWKATAEGSTWGGRVFFYKGLGTSTSAEGREYFSDLPRHIKEYVYDADSDTWIDLAFDPKKADQRKTWLVNGCDETLDYADSSVTIADFVNKDLIHFSLADIRRSIPDGVDGLKPSQRKALFGMFDLNVTSDQKVAQLVGKITARCSYHHGNVSMEGTIINMAQDYVGANNVPLLVPSGQFGTRLAAGSDAASPRYIFTRLSPLASTLFPSADLPVLDYVVDDGVQVEPVRFYPILPMLLVNGGKGIGTGWSTNVLMHSPIDVADAVKALLDGDDFDSPKPWYRGFRGVISGNHPTFTCDASYETLDDGRIRILDIPIGKSTNDYIEFLDKLEESGKIASYVKEHTEDLAQFVVKLSASATVADLELSRKMDKASNMHAIFNGRVRLFTDAKDLIRAFYDERLSVYVKRKAHIIATLDRELLLLSEKMRFILAVINKEIKVFNVPRATVEARLDELEFARLARGDGPVGYDYLLSMPISSLTLENVQKMQRDRDAKATELEAMRGRDPKDIWRSEIDAFVEAYVKWEEARAAFARGEAKKRKRDDSAEGSGAAKKRKAPAKTR